MTVTCGNDHHQRPGKFITLKPTTTETRL